jgi:hypothetical protein
MKLQGKYGKATVFTDAIEQEAISQSLAAFSHL